MRALCFAAAAFAVSGCIVVDADVDGFDDYDYVRGAERLYAASVEPDGVRVRVASNGCTNEESFDVRVNRTGRDDGVERYSVYFDRENPDRCRAMLPDGVELFFTRERLGLPQDASIQIANPIRR